MSYLSLYNIEEKIRVPTAIKHLTCLEAVITSYVLPVSVQYQGENQGSCNTISDLSWDCHYQLCLTCLCIISSRKSLYNIKEKIRVPTAIKHLTCLETVITSYVLPVSVQYRGENQGSYCDKTSYLSWGCHYQLCLTCLCTISRRKSGFLQHNIWPILRLSLPAMSYLSLYNIK